MRKFSIANTLFVASSRIRRISCCSLILFSSSSLFAFAPAVLETSVSTYAFFQSGNIRITGKVTSTSGELLSQASVSVKGTTTAVLSDSLGNFTINAPETGTLVVSYAGFQTTEIAIGGQTMLNISLTATSGRLNEVIVVGYTSQKRGSITGAVSSVSLPDAEKLHIPDVAQSLQGLVPGVFVAANTGAPGDGVKIRIRGEGTLGNNDVLYVVDGVPTRDISFLNGNDIRSMTVLKDASATAIYGSRSANGVVLVTTNIGQKGKTSITGSYFSGFYRATNLPKMLNADQYLTVKDMAWHNTAGNAAGATSPYASDRSRTDLANTDWQKELFTTGISRNFHVAASGGNDKTQYLLSASYFSQNGIVVEDHDKYERMHFRVNINSDISDRFRIGTNLQITYAKQDKLSSSGDAPGIIRHALIRPPVLGVYKDVNDPTYSATNPYTDLPFYTGPDNGWLPRYEYTSNPIAIVHFTDDKRYTYKTFGNVYAEYAFLRDKSLRFKTSIGADIVMDHNKNFGENFGDPNISDPANIYYGLGRNNRPNSLNENRGQSMNFTFSNTLNYNKTVSKHSINALVGSETISSKASAIGGSRQNFDNTDPAFRYLDYGGQGSATLPYPYNSGSATSSYLLSFFGSATYGYDNKYFATANLRADASSRFGPNNKWGYFPSISAGWVVSQEEFLKDIDWVSSLKLRASWGKSGNQEIGDHSYEKLFIQVDGVPKLIRMDNPDVKWETTTQTNYGLDLSVLKNKLYITADYFVKKTTDILLLVKLPTVTAGEIDPAYINSGAVNNKGFEFGVRYQNDDRAFKYGVNANIATLNNRVKKLYTYVQSIIDDNTHTQIKVGQPKDAYFGYQFDGIYQNVAEVNKTLFTNTNGTVAGDIKFKDINNDGQIDANDRTFIGNPIPKLTYGFSFNAAFKGFDFSFLFQGVQGVDRYNDLKQILNYDSRPFNSMVSVLDSWHGEGTSNTTPRLTFNDNGGSRVSSVFVEDASYLRLKNVELGYTFKTANLGLNNLRLYVSGQNLLTSTNYTGLDPESTSLIDKGTYPQSKSFIVGAKIRL